MIENILYEARIVIRFIIIKVFPIPWEDLLVFLLFIIIIIIILFFSLTLWNTANFYRYETLHDY